jgi:hypothetical protein
LGEGEAVAVEEVVEKSLGEKDIPLDQAVGVERKKEEKVLGDDLEQEKKRTVGKAAAVALMVAVVVVAAVVADMAASIRAVEVEKEAVGS